MAEITKISSKGQIVIPQDIRNALNLKPGTNIVMEKMSDYVVLKKMDIPDIKREFRRLTKEGMKKMKSMGIKSEEELMKILKR